MDLGTWILVGVVAVLGINRFLVHLPGWHQRRAVFWAVQLANLATACFMIVAGVPGLPGLARYVNWVIALLFVFHIVQNNSRLVEARKQAREATQEQDQAARARVAAALQRTEPEGDPEP